jgi:hypothetical protein
MRAARETEAAAAYDVTQTTVVTVHADPAATREATGAVALVESARKRLNLVAASLVGAAGRVGVDWNLRTRPSEDGAYLSVTLGFTASDDESREALLDAWGTIGPAAEQAAKRTLKAIKAYAEDESWQPRGRALALAA